MHDSEQSCFILSVYGLHSDAVRINLFKKFFIAFFCHLCYSLLVLHSSVMMALDEILYRPPSLVAIIYKCVCVYIIYIFCCLLLFFL